MGWGGGWGGVERRGGHDDVMGFVHVFILFDVSKQRQKYTPLTKADDVRNV